MRRHNDEFTGEPYVVIERHDSGIGPLLLGLALGAGAALLFAPRSGEDTRRIIKDRARGVSDAARERIDDLTTSFSESIDQAREAVADRVETVRETVRHRRNEFHDALDAGRSAAREARIELERKLAERKVEDRQTNKRQHADPTVALHDDIA